MMEVVPDKMIPADDLIPRFTRPPASNDNPPLRTEPLRREGFEQVRDQFVPHVRNFLEAVKSRQQPLSHLESSHQSNITTHLVNIALRTKRLIRWDAEREQIIGDADASRLMTREYRAPWERELKGALPK